MMNKLFYNRLIEYSNFYKRKSQDNKFLVYIKKELLQNSLKERFGGWDGRLV